MTQADWVKEFRKRFVHKGEVGGSFEVAGEPSKDIEDFISKVESLAQQRTEKKWREKCKGMEKKITKEMEMELGEDYPHYEHGYNQALSDLLK